MAKSTKYGLEIDGRLTTVRDTKIEAILLGGRWARDFGAGTSIRVVKLTHKAAAALEASLLEA